MLKLLRQRIAGLTESVVRFPVTVAFLVAATVLTSMVIERETEYYRWIMTCAVGAVACAAAQTAYERFLSGAFWRIVLTVCGVIVGALFHLSVRMPEDNSVELLIRPAVTLFALFVVFSWVGVIKSRYSFCDSFMAAFKALFQAAFFSGILFLGVIAILAAIDRLIAPIDENAAAHTANIVFLLAAPLMLLSLIPVYPGRAELLSEETPGSVPDGRYALVDKRIRCPRFLEILLSYIIAPLIAVFTVILLVYILINIGGQFWTNNLLEPMLIAYTVAVIAAVLLAFRLENRFAVLFLKIFPKVLIPIALFQAVASGLILADTGVTYGRYYVILYGVFAVLSGLVLSFLPLRKSGIVALLLILLSAVSLIPPVDAFTVSRNSQIRTLEATLTENGMLNNGIVTPRGDIPQEDKTKIINTVRYLSETEELDRVSWLPARFYGWDDTQFYEVFGFHMYQPTLPEYRYISVYYDNSTAVPIAGYDYMVRVTLPWPEKPGEAGQTFTVGGNSYVLTAEPGASGQAVIVRDDAGTELFRYDTSVIFKRYEDFPQDKIRLTLEEAVFTAISPDVDAKIIVMNASFAKEPQIANTYADVLVLVKVK